MFNFNSNRRNRGRLGHLKKTWLVSARDNWPPINKSGLSMSLDHTIQSTNNVQYLVYDHNPSYRQVQLKFLEAVESLNPENIVVCYISIRISFEKNYLKVIKLLMSYFRI